MAVAADGAGWLSEMGGIGCCSRLDILCGSSIASFTTNQEGVVGYHFIVNYALDTNNLSPR